MPGLSGIWSFARSSRNIKRVCPAACANASGRASFLLVHETSDQHIEIADDDREFRSPALKKMLIRFSAFFTFTERNGVHAGFYENIPVGTKFFRLANRLQHAEGLRGFDLFIVDHASPLLYGAVLKTQYTFVKSLDT